MKSKIKNNIFFKKKKGLKTWSVIGRLNREAALDTGRLGQKATSDIGRLNQEAALEKGRLFGTSRRRHDNPGEEKRSLEQLHIPKLA